MQAQSQGKLSINVKLEITSTALQAVMTQAKKRLKHQTGEARRMDTADYVGLVISKFLVEKDFEAYALNCENHD